MNAGRKQRPPRPRLDRLSPDDLMSLVGSRDAAPPQVGAVLVLNGGVDLDLVAVSSFLDRRLPAVPRLRQKLVLVPFGCGRPVWADDPGFDLQDHLAVHTAAGPVGHQALLDLAADLVTRPLPHGRPLWRAELVTDVGSERAALIFVFHHVLADGEAGLAVLAHLLSAGSALPDLSFPRPQPSRGDLTVDAVRDRLGSAVRLPATLGRLAAAAGELVPAVRRTAPRCSLNQPTGPVRRFRTVNAGVAELVELAHREGVTVNDVLLTAVAGALRDLLAARGEQIPYVVVSVPFSTRPRGGKPGLGNHSGVVAIRLPTDGTFAARLASTAVSTRAAKRHRRGASTAILAPAFRLLDRLGIYQHFVNHQRQIHTFVSNVQGPVQALELAGHPLVALIPLSVASGNVTVAFTALSYHGRLVLTINADPSTCPDLDRLRDALADQLESLGVLTADVRVGLLAEPPP